MSQQFANYDKTLISVLEILGSHFVDTFFNHVWVSARTHLKAGTSITDEYTKRVQAYITGVKNDERCYRDVVMNLHKYFQATTRYTTLSFPDFVERIVVQFIPEEYYDLLKSSEKDETLSSILADLVSGMGVYVTSPDMLRRIIDEHDEQPGVTIRMIQDQGVTILLQKRGEIHNKFLKRVGQTKETVSIEMVDSLKQVIRGLVKQKAVLKTKLAAAQEEAEDLQHELTRARRRESKFKRLIRMLNEERRRGAVDTALAARVPKESRIAEHDEDPLDRGESEPPRDLKRHTRPVRPKPVKKPVNKPAGKTAGFFDLDDDKAGDITAMMAAPPVQRTRRNRVIADGDFGIGDEGGEDGEDGEGGEDYEEEDESEYEDNEASGSDD